MEYGEGEEEEEKRKSARRRKWPWIRQIKYSAKSQQQEGFFFFISEMFLTAKTNLFSVDNCRDLANSPVGNKVKKEEEDGSEIGEGREKRGILLFLPSRTPSTHPHLPPYARIRKRKSNLGSISNSTATIRTYYGTLRPFPPFSSFLFPSLFFTFCLLCSCLRGRGFPL